MCGLTRVQAVEAESTITSFVSKQEYERIALTTASIGEGGVFIIKSTALIVQTALIR